MFRSDGIAGGLLGANLSGTNGNADTTETVLRNDRRNIGVDRESIPKKLSVEAMYTAVYVLTYILRHIDT
jgi:hypothetical protein